jgi:hypothetical protein
MTAQELAALVDWFADRIAARISNREPATYSSRDLPPRYSRRRFAEVCRSGRVADAKRDGRDWVCSYDAWQAAWGHPVSRKQTTSLEMRATDLLTRAGVRVKGWPR